MWPPKSVTEVGMQTNKYCVARLLLSVVLGALHGITFRIARELTMPVSQIFMQLRPYLNVMSLIPLGNFTGFTDSSGSGNEFADWRFCRLWYTDLKADS